MVLIAKLLSFAVLGQAAALQSRQDPPPPTGDPSNTEYFLSLANEATVNATRDIGKFRGNSTNLDNDLNNIYVGVFNAGDSTEGPHLNGYFNKKDALKICKFINVTLSNHNKNFLKTAVASKKKFIRYNYNSSFIDSIADLRNQYSYAIGYISSACYYGPPTACNDAAGIIDNQYATAITALSS